VAAESDVAAMEAAMLAYDDDKLAASSKGGTNTRLGWWRARAARAFPPFEPYPLTVEKLRRALAMLKLGGYRSAALYVSAIRIKHIRQGHSWDDMLALEAREGLRSALRGIGPPQRCPAMDLARLANLAADTVQAVPHGPANPRDAALVGAWWALRELELGAARRDQLELGQGSGCGSATLHLPASKTDPMGAGRARTHGCSCAESPAMCPVAAARRTLSHEKEAGPESPLFPTTTGQFCSKEGSVATFQKLAVATGLQERVTGHTLRVTGAQAMAKAGMDLWQIQLFCRWGSSAVLGYVRDAPLAVSGRIAPMVAQSLTLGEVRLEIEDCLNERDPGHGAPATAVTDIIDDILEKRLAVDKAELDTVLAEIRDKLTSLDLTMSTLMTEWDEVRPVVDTSPRWAVSYEGKVHAIDVTGESSVCGWTWAKDQVIFLHEFSDDWILCKHISCAPLLAEAMRRMEFGVPDSESGAVDEAVGQMPHEL